MLNHVNRGAESHGRGDHGVAGPNTKDSQGKMQGCGAGTQGQSLGSANRGREVTFKALYLRTRGNPVGAKRVHDLGNFFFANERRREGQECLSHMWSYGLSERVKG